LHSNKANRRILLDELRRTWELGQPRGAPVDAADAGLESSRNLLNRHAFRMHKALPASGLTPYALIGQLARIQRVNGAAGDLRLDGAEWTRLGLLRGAGRRSSLEMSGNCPRRGSSRASPAVRLTMKIPRQHRSRMWRVSWGCFWLEAPHNGHYAGTTAASTTR